MGKRSSGIFERQKRDFYPTPFSAVTSLLPHLLDKTVFDEPCAGNGALVSHLESAGHKCLRATDIDPQRDDIGTFDVFDIESAYGDCFITNPPWNRKFLHPLILHLCEIAPTWLLFDADWMHTRQAAPYMPYCKKIVSVGRVKWIEDSPHTGKDNAAWYLFYKKTSDGPVDFWGRR